MPKSAVFRAISGSPSKIQQDFSARPEERGGNTDLGTLLRVAYFGGPLMAQLLVDAPERLSFGGADRWRGQSFLLSVKATQALAIPLHDEQSVVRYLKAFMDYNWTFAN